MQSAKWFSGFVLCLAAATLLSASGCQKEEGGKKGGEKLAKKGDVDKDGDKDAGHGWWCSEHGVPESLCSLCLADDEVKKKYKDTGDWCKLHDRAQSQCFKCDPKLYAKYEAMYEAKYGKKPPRPPASEFTK